MNCFPPQLSGLSLDLVEVFLLEVLLWEVLPRQVGQPPLQPALAAAATTSLRPEQSATARSGFTMDTDIDPLSV